MVVLDEVVASAAEYDRLHENLKSIQEEWKGIRNSLKAKMEPLRQRQNELEGVILEYLESNQLPGVKLHGTLFLREEIVQYKSRESKIEDILKSEPPTSRPDAISKKILTVLRKRIADRPPAETPDPDQKRQYRLKIFRQ